jgi:hypothetical protein
MPGGRSVEDVLLTRQPGVTIAETTIMSAVWLYQPSNCWFSDRAQWCTALRTAQAKFRGERPSQPVLRRGDRAG